MIRFALVDVRAPAIDSLEPVFAGFADGALAALTALATLAAFSVSRTGAGTSARALRVRAPQVGAARITGRARRALRFAHRKRGALGAGRSENKRKRTQEDKKRLG
jgi:hypothetical protein